MSCIFLLRFGHFGPYWTNSQNHLWPAGYMIEARVYLMTVSRSLCDYTAWRDFSESVFSSSSLSDVAYFSAFVIGIHAKNLVSILNLLVKLMRAFNAPRRLPENVVVYVISVQVRRWVYCNVIVEEIRAAWSLSSACIFHWMAVGHISCFGKS